MTLDEFETRIVDMRDDIVNLTPILTEIGNDITRELQQAAPTGKTGNLQSSIRLEVQPQQFAVSMLAYGVFQNYGVVGVDGGDRVMLLERKSDGLVMEFVDVRVFREEGGVFVFSAA